MKMVFFTAKMPTIIIDAMNDSVPLLVNYAAGCAPHKTTFMALKMALCTSAGKSCYLLLLLFPPQDMRRQQHSCNATCNESGICEIETAPHSIEATFTGTHETFQYTKVGVHASSCVSMLTVLKVYTRSVDVGLYSIGGASPLRQLRNAFHVPFRSIQVISHIRDLTSTVKSRMLFISAQSGP